MRTVAVTAGMQWWYPEAARRFTERFNRLASYRDDGFECVNANELLKGQWSRIKDHRFIKSYLWDVLPEDIDRILWLDCDMFQSRPIGLSDLPDVPWAAVRDTKWTDEKTREEYAWAQNEVIQFFNGGVFLAKRETRDIFEFVKGISEQIIAGEMKTHHTGDQKWFNLAVARKYKDFANNYSGWLDMGNEWNVIKGRDRPRQPIFTHFAGVHDRWTIMELMYNAADEVERFLLRQQGVKPDPDVGPGAVGNGKGVEVG